MDTLQVCHDFKSRVCFRPQCKYLHLDDGNFIFLLNKQFCKKQKKSKSDKKRLIFVIKVELKNKIKIRRTRQKEILEKTNLRF